jgi:hypothetical protein
MSEIFARTYGVELLCSQPPQIPRDVLLAHLQRRCPGAQPLDPDPQATSLTFVHPTHLVQLQDGQIPAQTFVAISPQPPSADYQPAVQQAWDFKEAAAAVARCQATVLVSDMMSSGLDHRERLDLFQRALRAVLDTEKCEAIHWTRSDRIVEARTWVHAFDAGDPARAFMAGAVNVRMFNATDPSGAPTMVMDTLGLGALGLPDLQCHFAGLDPGAVARVLYNSAWYLFTEGDVIADGNTIQGITPTSKWTCRHEEALVAPVREVLDLDPGLPHTAGNRRR